MKNKRKSRPVERADYYYRRIVLSQGFCPVCGRTYGLNTCHIVRRGKHLLRWNLKNSVCACDSCHRYWENNPYKYSEWLLENLENARERLDYLTLLEQKTRPIKDFEVMDIKNALKALYNQKMKEGKIWNSLKADWI
jgi:hypothetical protein